MEDLGPDDYIKRAASYCAQERYYEALEDLVTAASIPLKELASRSGLVLKNDGGMWMFVCFIRDGDITDKSNKILTDEDKKMLDLWSLVQSAQRDIDQTPRGGECSDFLTSLVLEKVPLLVKCLKGLIDRGFAFDCDQLKETFPGEFVFDMAFKDQNSEE